MLTLENIEQVKTYVGSDIGTSSWFEVTQDVVNSFADVTKDHQFIHIDTEKAQLTPFGGTIAHGFLSLSMLSHFAADGCGLSIGNAQMSINYGFDKVRFVHPVKVGSRIRGHSSLIAVEEKKTGDVLLRLNVSVEIENVKKPALIAQWLILVVV